MQNIAKPRQALAGKLSSDCTGGLPHRMYNIHEIVKFPKPPLVAGSVYRRLLIREWHSCDITGNIKINLGRIDVCEVLGGLARYDCHPLLLTAKF